MSKKIKIFIITFIVAIVVFSGIYLWINKDKTTNTDGTTPWYQSFNPFGTGTNIPGDTTTPLDTGTTNPTDTGIVAPTSRFYQITDFAVAGATFLEDTRPIIETATETVVAPVVQEPIKTVIDSKTLEGRKEIQTILNKTLSLNPPLVTDGNFGKLTTKAIGEFQKLNKLTVTGKIDEATAPLFTKTVETINTETAEKSKYEIVPSIRFAEKKNGHIYKMFLDTKNQEKISNSTIPNIHEAFFDATGKTVIYRYLSNEKAISSFIATMGTPKGDYLPTNISDVSLSQDKSKYFYLVEDVDGVTGLVGLFGGIEDAIVFSSPLTEWLSQWAGNQKIFLTTKASYNAEGSMFLLNTDSKTINKVFGGITGLTTLVNPRASLTLYSSFTKTGPALGIFDMNTYEKKDLGKSGLPEKCVWSNDNINIYCAIPNTIVGYQYPDYWYQGLVSFDDIFVKINTSTGEIKGIANSAEETPIDATNLFLSKTEDFLFFINKKDSTLWSLNIR